VSTCALLLGAAHAVLDELLDAVALADEPAHLEVPHLLAPRLVGGGVKVGLRLSLGLGLGWAWAWVRVGLGLGLGLGYRV
jgi:hypothetical protein